MVYRNSNSQEVEKEREDYLRQFAAQTQRTLAGVFVHPDTQATWLVFENGSSIECYTATPRETKATREHLELLVDRLKRITDLWFTALGPKDVKDES